MEQSLDIRPVFLLLAVPASPSSLSSGHVHANMSLSPIAPQPGTLHRAPIDTGIFLQRGQEPSKQRQGSREQDELRMVTKPQLFLEAETSDQ